MRKRLTLTEALAGLVAGITEACPKCGGATKGVKFPQGTFRVCGRCIVAIVPTKHGKVVVAA